MSGTITVATLEEQQPEGTVSSAQDKHCRKLPCQTKLLPDNPGEADQFGPHIKIAKALAKMVLDPEMEGGIVIGIEGEWGSGKTTVIRLLEKQLKQQSETPPAKTKPGGEAVETESKETMSRWLKAARADGADAFRGHGLRTPQEQELYELRQKVKQLEE